MTTDHPDLIEAEMLAKLSHASVGPLVAVLVHLTGETRWLEPPFLPEQDLRLFPDSSGGLDEAAQHEIRSAVLDLLMEGPDALEARTAMHIPDDELLLKMMQACIGADDIGEQYLPLAREQLGLESSSLDWQWSRPNPPRVAIVGGGMSGICAGIRFDEAAIPYTLFEKSEGFGGTWLDNRYPQSGVDTPSLLYCYSFAQHHRWSGYFSKQPEVQAYFAECANRFGVVQSTRFGTEVTRACWDEASQVWLLDTLDGSGALETTEFDIVVSAIGMLNRPKIPPIEGLENFAGESFHSARWRPDVDVAGRLAVIGTGASAMQFAPVLAESAELLTIFQRSPNWIVPTPNYSEAVPEEVHWALETVPFYREWERLGTFWRFGDRLHAALRMDPEWTDPDRSVNAINDRHRKFLERYMRERLGDDPDEYGPDVIPDYPPYGKRMLIDNGWIDMLKKENVNLVSSEIARVEPDGIVTGDGMKHLADVMVFATGFDTTNFCATIDVVGRGGVHLANEWGNENARAFLGMTVPKFPNMFMIFGPNTALGHGGSVIFHTECQVRYIIGAMKTMEVHGLSSIDCNVADFETYNQDVDRALDLMVWSHQNVRSWYKNSAGRVVTNSPWKLVDYWERTRDFNPSNFELERASP